MIKTKIISATPNTKNGFCNIGNKIRVLNAYSTDTSGSNITVESFVYNDSYTFLTLYTYNANTGIKSVIKSGTYNIVVTYMEG